MEELIDIIGKRIQYHRKNMGITLKKLAEEVGVTPSLLSQIEHGKASPSLSTLKLIADVFSVPIGMLFESGKATVDSPVFKKNTHKKMITKGNVTYNLLSQNCNAMEVFILEFPPGSSTGSEAYVHDGAECGFLHKGRLLIEIEGKEYELSEGDSVVFDSYKPHKIKNVSNETAIAYWTDSIPWVFRTV